MRRTLFALLGSLVACAASASHIQGGTAKSSHWAISAGNALIWDGAPYLPVGLRIDGSPAAVDDAGKAGFKDLLVDLPVGGEGWGPTITSLQNGKFRFLLGINSLAHMAEGYSVQPDGNRVTNIKDQDSINLNIPGATSVLAILATSRDGEVQRIVRVNTPGGQFKLTVDPANDLDHIVLLYPKMTSEQEPDFWEGLDAQRDRLLETLKKFKPGDGLRGIVNPIGTLSHLPGPDVPFVPTSPYFQFELKSYLISKYRNLETAEQSWSMRTSDIDTFDKLSRLVPLWWGSKGLQQLLDPVTDKLYPTENKHSQIWDDIHAVLNSSAQRRFQRLTNALHAVADVPVVQEWGGWGVPYEGNPAVDGVGITCQGTAPSDYLDTASKAASSLLRWRSGGWLPATRIEPGDKASDSSVQPMVEDLVSLGARGLFLRSDNTAIKNAFRASGNGALTSNAATAVVHPLFFPENATNPAFAQSFPGNYWWLPAPYNGNRLDFGNDIKAYQLEDSTGLKFVMWSTQGSEKMKLNMGNPKAAIVTSIDGSPVFSSVIKSGVIVELSSVPIIVSGIREVPVPEVVIDNMNQHFAQLTAVANERRVDSSDIQYDYHNCKLEFPKAPGASFTSMRKDYDSLSLKVASYSWIKSENPTSYTIGQSISEPGAFGDKAFQVRSHLSRPGETYRMIYSFVPRSQEDQELWIAARIPPSYRHAVQVIVGSQSFRITEPPLSPYGNGYAWYRLGVTKLGSEERKTIRFELDATDGVDISLDTILLFPGNFKPSGVEIPDALTFSRPQRAK